MTRTPLLAILVVGLVACEVPETDETLTGSPPGRSVLVVLIDTLRADHTSIVEHRHGRNTTPFLDALSDESIVFERAYSPASWTRASVASLFTSRLPSSHGCEDRDGILVPELVTLGEAFQDAGYETHAVITNGNILAKMGFDQGFDAYVHVRDFPRNDYADALKVREPILQAVDGFLGEPWFLYTHYVDVHDPYLHHPEADYSPEYAGDLTGARESLKPYRWTPPPSPEDRQRIIDLYDGEILWFDAELKRLFAKLDKRGALDEAWVVITSDHGEGMWDHRIQSHGQEVFEEQIHVPLVIRPPGGLAARRRVTAPISLIDVGPTMLDLVGVEVPRDFEGISWAGFLRGDEDPAPARPVIIEELLENVEMAAIIDGTDKLIIEYHNPTTPLASQVKSVRLYDLVANPGERLELSVDARIHRSSRASGLERKLVEAIREATVRRPAPTGDLELSADEEAALRALGYLGDEMPDAPAAVEEEARDDGPGADGNDDG